jgi:hypothetical protein
MHLFIIIVNSSSYARWVAPRYGLDADMISQVIAICLVRAPAWRQPPDIGANIRHDDCVLWIALQKTTSGRRTGR